MCYCSLHSIHSFSLKSLSIYVDVYLFGIRLNQYLFTQQGVRYNTGRRTSGVANIVGAYIVVDEGTKCVPPHEKRCAYLTSQQQAFTHIGHSDHEAWPTLVVRHNSVLTKLHSLPSLLRSGNL